MVIEFDVVYSYENNATEYCASLSLNIFQLVL